MQKFVLENCVIELLGINLNVFPKEFYQFRNFHETDTTLNNTNTKNGKKLQVKRLFSKKQERIDSEEDDLINYEDIEEV